MSDWGVLLYYLLNVFFSFFIKDEDTGTAEIPVDHYDNKPFRDLYYKKTKSDSQNNMQSLEENLQKTGLNDTWDLNVV